MNGPFGQAAAYLASNPLQHVRRTLHLLHHCILIDSACFALLFASLTFEIRATHLGLLRLRLTTRVLPRNYVVSFHRSNRLTSALFEIFVQTLLLMAAI